jgi:hypothetical protein
MTKECQQGALPTRRALDAGQELGPGKEKDLKRQVEDNWTYRR